ncbi:MAG: acylphosphatase [Desulfuromonas sp.]|nr:MAG: acylphosphatase [Desulfuromonas sp.]
MNRQICATVRVRGKVQGVCYRASTQETARAYGLKGWVRNLPDGSVEACFQGEEQKVRAVIEWCRQGPPHAAIDSLDIDWEEVSESFANFSIRR